MHRSHQESSTSHNIIIANHGNITIMHACMKWHWWPWMDACVHPWPPLHTGMWDYDSILTAQTEGPGSRSSQHYHMHNG